MNPIDALGWALLHFLWQGTAIALALAAVLALMRDHPASRRYVACVVALALMLLLPVATLVRGMQAGGETTRLVLIPAMPSASVDVNVDATHDATPRSESTAPGAALTRMSAAPSAALTAFVRAWFCIVLFLAARLAWGWVGVRRLERRGTRPASAATQRLLADLLQRLGIRAPVRILESFTLDVPVVLGWLRPVILVPAAALAGLQSRQLEMILVHELAHVRRHDALVNGLQACLETLLFYHPAVWWVSRRVRDERENCCDDIVVATCRDAPLYAETLLGLERLRGLEARLVPAASGAPLLQRVRRLLEPGARRRDGLSRWPIGAIALTTLLGVATATHLSSAPTSSFESEILPTSDAAEPLEQRWSWAREQARQKHWRRYWVGYSIRPSADLGGAIYAVRLDGEDRIETENVSLQGHLVHIGEVGGFTAPGTRLPATLGAADDVALLFEFASGSVQRVIVASLDFPVNLRGEPLLWLAAAADDQSVPIVAKLQGDTRGLDPRADLVTAIGVHATSALVVPVLANILKSRAPADVRSEAAEWLGRHPDPQALDLLIDVARNDDSADVRREAAESVGEMRGAPATAAAIALAQDLPDPDAQREAIESLGPKSDAASLAALLEIARDPHRRDAAREATEALGERPDGQGIDSLVEIATRHPDSDVRREAVETLGNALPPEKAAKVLAEMARNNSSREARREAVETLGHLPGGLGADVVEQMARREADIEVRRQAIETLAQSRPPEAAAAILADIAAHEEDPQAGREALENLAQLPAGAGIPALLELARQHRDPEIRREAMRALVDSDDPRARKAVEHAFERP